MPDTYAHAKHAVELFGTFTDGTPDTVDIGLEGVRMNIGGLFKGNTVVLGAAQNVGKTSVIQHMLANSKDKGAVASFEDGPDVWGARVVAALSGVRPSRLRRKDLTKLETARIRSGLDALKKRSQQNLLPHVEMCIGKKPDDFKTVTRKMAEEGCKWAVLDYIQKVKGHHSERRIEVANTLTAWHEACYENGLVPVATSQVVRMEPTKEPNTWNLKESGDIENEARVIILFWRAPMGDKDRLNLRLKAKIAKSSFGGGGARFSLMFDESEQLVEYVEEEEDF